MSDIAIGRNRAGGGALFTARTLTLMVLLGVLGFVGLLVLGAYAPDLRSGRNGGAHALSNAATGYSGIVALARALGEEPAILRDPRLFDTEHLLILTPESGTVDISAALKGRETRPTLFVLPKWQTSADPNHSGWVQSQGVVPLFDPIGVLAPGFQFRMRRYRTPGGTLLTDQPFRFREPRDVQVITGLDTDARRMSDPAYREAVAIRPLLTDARGNILLARLGVGPLYVLADPDLLNNMGIRDERQAVAAIALLSRLNGGTLHGIAFDVSFNGFDHSRSPLKLLFEPPFVAMTLTVVAALMLAGVQAFGRFGPVRRRERAIALGKTALVDNSAAIIRKAGREAGMAGRYAAMIRERAARAFGAPAHLRDGPLEAYLDALRGTRTFTGLAEAADQARDRQAVLDAAQALYAWKQETIR